MKQLFCLSAVALILSSTSLVVWADANGWGNYRGVERSQKRYPTKTYKYTDQYGRQMSQEIPVRPQYPHAYPNHPYPNHPYPIYPPQNGVTIIYNQQLPTHTEYRSDSYGYVNGDGGRIESSKYMLISDWRRYGLPDPQVGMHWIFENGRYLQIENAR